MLKVFAATISALAFASAAQASVTVSIWTDQSGAAGSATLSQAGSLGSANAITNVSSINFDSSNGYTVGGFLNNPAGLNSTVASHDLNNTYMLFTGSTYLNAGNNAFVVGHDDGLQLNIDGIGLVVDAPGPTPPVDTPFNVIAPLAGFYNFEMSYGECCGAPAHLVWNVNGAPVSGGVPEPATWGMMLVGFGAVGATLRRRRRKNYSSKSALIA